MPPPNPEILLPYPPPMAQLPPPMDILLEPAKLQRLRLPKPAPPHAPESPPLPLERDTDTLLKLERLPTGPRAELVLKPRWLLVLMVLMVHVLDMLPDVRKAEESREVQGE